MNKAIKQLLAAGTVTAALPLTILTTTAASAQTTHSAARTRSATQLDQSPSYFKNLEAGKCLQRDNSTVSLAGCNHSGSQAWYAQYYDRTGKIWANSGHTLCLGIDNAGNAVVQTCNGSDVQEWKPTRFPPMPTGSFGITSQSGKFHDYYLMASTGNKVTVNPINYKYDQLWVTV
jgi:hypothetical protein